MLGETALTAAEELEAAALGVKLEQGRLDRDKLSQFLLQIGRRVSRDFEARVAEAERWLESEPDVQPD